MCVCVCVASVALSTDRLSGAVDEARMLRQELNCRDDAVRQLTSEMDRLRRHSEQLNSNYQTALIKYSDEQQRSVHTPV